MTIGLLQYVDLLRCPSNLLDSVDWHARGDVPAGILRRLLENDDALLVGLGGDALLTAGRW